MMSYVLVIILTLFLPVLAAGLPDDLKTDIDSLAEYSIDASTRIEISNLEIPLLYGRVLLDDGVLYVTGHYNDNPTAAFFAGKGSFFYHPPDDIETQQVKRFYNADSIHVKFEQAYFAFPWNSTIFKDLVDRGRPEEPPYRIKTLFNHIRQIPDKRFKYNLPLNIYKASVEDKPELLWIDFLKDRYQHTIYFYCPFVPEPVSVYKYTSNFKKPQVVSSAGEGEAWDREEFKYDYKVISYDLDVDISTVAKSSIRCEMTLEVLTDSLILVHFNFPAEYRVDSVFGAVSDSRSFIKKKDRPGLTIGLARYHYRRDTVRVGVAYRTNLFRHYLQYGVIQDHLIHWYPYYGYRQLSDYNLTYRIDPGFDFISVGQKKSDTIIDDKRVLKYRSTTPIAYISFNYGIFDSVLVEDADIPIVIRFLESRHKSAIFGNANIRRVVNDVAGSFRFYEQNFGPYPFDRLDVAAMAVGFGQGSPGVVHMPEKTFVRSIDGLDDKLRAHEVAHQWWGHLINPADYHDAWLSEGMAEYSAAMYIEQAKGEQNLFREILKNWKNSITQRGKLSGKRSVGFRAGAVILGLRLASEMSPGDYEALVYYKAAYMMHMLRFELEKVNGRPGLLLNMLAEFTREFSGQLVSTDDFINIARRYLGDRMERFFDQWLYDWRVPKIKKKRARIRDNSVDIILNVSQVGDGFETPYPIRIGLDNGEEVSVIYKIRKGENRFNFSLPDGAGIKSVDFNPDYDILEQ
jgi:hypothetical protein